MLAPRRSLAVQRCVMLERTLSLALSSISRGEKLDQEVRDIVDHYFTTASILTARIWSKHPRSRPSAPPKIEVSTQTDWRDVGQALRARLLERARERCDCYSCRNQDTKRGQREKHWVNLVAQTELGDPSLLVGHLNSRRLLTQFDRKCLADLLDAVFRGETRAVLSPIGRPKNLAVRNCAGFAIKFYTDWKAINRQWRIKDWGHSDEMKDEACRVAIDYHLARRDLLRLGGRGLTSNHLMDEVPDFEQVRELMDRPRDRWR
jgi:hypothetical protein